MDSEELLQLCYLVTSRADWFVVGMTKASLEYNTQVAITADCPQDIKLDAFCRVIQRFSEDTTSLAMPEPAAAHVLANKEQSVEEQVNANKLILDSANAHQTKGQVMAMETARYMEDHQINVVRQLVMGNFTSAALKKINQNTVLLSIVAYSSLSTKQIQQLGDELD